jgi:hypothetical protein
MADMGDMGEVNLVTEKEKEEEEERADAELDWRWMCLPRTARASPPS